MRNDAASPFFSSRPGVAGQPDGAENSRISQDLSGWRTWYSAWMASRANRRYWRKDGKGRFARLGLCRTERRVDAEGLAEFGYSFTHSAEFSEGNTEVVQQFRTGRPVFEANNNVFYRV